MCGKGEARFREPRNGEAILGFLSIRQGCVVKNLGRKVKVWVKNERG